MKSETYEEYFENSGLRHFLEEEIPAFFANDVSRYVYEAYVAGRKRGQKEKKESQEGMKGE